MRESRMGLRYWKRLSIPGIKWCKLVWWILHENELSQDLSGNEVDYTNSLKLLAKNMLCCELHCQKGLIVFSFHIRRYTTREFNPEGLRGTNCRHRSLFFLTHFLCYTDPTVRLGETETKFEIGHRTAHNGFNREMVLSARPRQVSRSLVRPKPKKLPQNRDRALRTAFDRQRLQAWI